MCTVTFINSNGKYIITSNRDEMIARPALEPRKYFVNGQQVFYPKDSKAGGTWYAVSEKGRVVVLLNGAEERLARKAAYRMSRGLIVLELISAVSVLQSWRNINLNEIESFTLVVFEADTLYQLQWNEVSKSETELDAAKNYIWSSATLYPKAVREQRAEWFARFVKSNPVITESEMMTFHHYAENEDCENGLVINRDNILKTLSITQTIIQRQKVTLNHEDLTANQQFTNTFISV